MGRNKAIIVGISDYKSPADKLKNARRSAEWLESCLRAHYVFDDVIPLYDSNATKNGIVDAIRSLQHLGPSDSLLLALCGHGYRSQSREKWYFLPQDANRDKRDHREVISGYELFEELFGEMKVGHVLAIIDACHAGALVNTRHIEAFGSESDEASVGSLMSPERPSRYVIASGRADEAVPDGGGSGPSPFMEELCERLAGAHKLIVPADQLAVDVRAAVAQRLKLSLNRASVSSGHIGPERGTVFCFIHRPFPRPEVRKNYGEVGRGEWFDPVGDSDKGFFVSEFHTPAGMSREQAKLLIKEMFKKRPVIRTQDTLAQKKVRPKIEDHRKRVWEANAVVRPRGRDKGRGGGSRK